MKRVLYAGMSFLTGDEMAHVVATYATSLARVGEADTVCVPVIKDGLLNSVEIVLGPASQLVIEDAGQEFHDEFANGSFLDDIKDRLYRLENPQQVQPVSSDDESLVDDM